MRKIILPFVFTAIASVAVSLPVNADNIIVDGQSRSYIKYVPSTLGSKRPLLISMHGMNQDAAYQKNMLQVEPIADTEDFAVVFPEGIDRAWDISGTRDIKFVEALINQMKKDHDIDPARVYLSGFSMGGMFTYHAMNHIADKIAAFAPISGYPMGGQAYTSSRPVPIIHIHGTGDDVVNFGGVKNILNGWIARNGCPATATVTTNYRNNITTRHYWGPGDNGVEVVLLELKDKGHWISNDGYKSAEEIWKFCSRFSLNSDMPQVKVTAPAKGAEYITVGASGTTGSIVIKAEASSAKNSIKVVKFYGDGKLLGEVKAEPYQWEWTALTPGNHSVKVEAVDTENVSVAASSTFSISSAAEEFNLSAGFISGGIVPAGWQTFDGNEHRYGPLSGLGMGARILQMTGSPRDFDYALYTRNVSGAADSGCAAYGGDGSTVTLSLAPGQYELSYVTCNWNMAAFGEVRCRVVNSETQTVIASKAVTPAANVGNTASNPFSGSSEVSVPFSITAATQCQIAFYTADAPWADLLVSKVMLRKTGNNSVDEVLADHGNVVSTEAYDFSGRRVEGARGAVIVRTTYSDGTVITRKVVN